MAALQYFNLESSGVPFLVVGDRYLIGSNDIPMFFPGLIEQHLAEGGIDWPAIPGLAEAMAAAAIRPDANTTAHSPNWPRGRGANCRANHHCRNPTAHAHT